MLAQAIPFHPEDDQEIFAQIPAAPGVFRLRAIDPAGEPYISKSSHLRRRIARLLGPPERAGVSKRLNLRDRCASIEFTATTSDFENTLLLYRLLRAHFPETYVKRLRLAPAPLIKIDWENAYPRAYVTTRLGKLGGRVAYYGPFRSRTLAEKYCNDALDLFKSRRCTFELNPDPTFPGCVYSEMKMCLAPCFQGCTDEEYITETARVEEFFASQGQSLIMPMTAERERASEALEFEHAKALHEKVEKVKAVAREADEIVRRVDQLDAVIVLPGPVLYRFHEAQVCGPVAVGAGERPTVSSWAEIIEQLAAPKKLTVAESAEHLSLLKRWYYRSHKAGEIVLRKADGSWPLRKIANAVERVSPRRGGGTAEKGEGEAEPRPQGEIEP